MSRRIHWIGLFASLALMAHGASIETLDLKPYVDKTFFDNIPAEWTLPYGRQVIDGTPFQIDGMVCLTGGKAKKKNGRENINNITVGRSFETVHLLCAAQSKIADGLDIGFVDFLYADGTKATAQLNYGEHVREWFGPWHKAEPPLKGSGSREAWRFQFSAAASHDCYLRLFHVTLANPNPAKEVRAISVRSANRIANLIMAAMSVGAPHAAESMDDTVPPMKSPFPDLRPRHGALARGEGIVKNMNGEPIAGVHVRIVATRQMSEAFWQATDGDPAVGREVTTSAAGRFIFPPLPDDVLYHYLVFADGLEARLYGGADVKSDPVEIRLRTPGPPPSFALHGRVVDAQGRPVAWAPLKLRAFSKEQNGNWDTTGLPKQYISDAKGEFTVGREKEFASALIQVRADGFAPDNEWLDTKNSTIELTEGVLVRGRVLKDGKPLANVRVAVSARQNQLDYASHYDAQTDNDGVFQFPHLRPHTSWTLFGVMSSFKTHGVLMTQEFMTAADGATNDLGDMTIAIPGLHLAGQIKTRQGEPIPDGTKILAAYAGRDDSQAASVDAQGHFAFAGLRSGVVQLQLKADGWRFARLNRSFGVSAWDMDEMAGFLTTNKDDLIVLIEKGQNDCNFVGGMRSLPPQDMPESRPLSGIEPGAPYIILAGKVIDDSTGKPVKKFELITGRQPPITSAMSPAQKSMLQKMLEPFAKKRVPWNEIPWWDTLHVEAGSNGVFSMEFTPLLSQPIMQVRAAGYDICEIGPVAVTTTNLVARLKRGGGPNGIVLLPTGEPAEDAIVVYAARHEQLFLQQEKARWMTRHKSVVTKKDGKFSFLPQADGVKIFVSHPAGWGEETVEPGGSALKIQLEPWAALTGKLVNSNGTPAVGMHLTLMTFENWKTDEPHLILEYMTTTDAKGNFMFTNVPPRRVNMYRMLPTGSPGAFSSKLQTWAVPDAGKTNDLGNVIIDKPPPPPVLDQLKQKLGL